MSACTPPASSRGAVVMQRRIDRVEGSSRGGRFDFGLSDVEEARAARLHRDSIVFDMVARLAGPALFEQYSAELKADLQARIAAARGKAEALAEAIYWPFEMARLGKSDAIRP